MKKLLIIYIPLILYTNNFFAQEIYSPNSSRTPTSVDLTIDGESIQVQAQRVAGRLVLGGDMIIGSHSGSGRGLGAVTDVNSRWPSATIPYAIVDGHPLRDMIIAAVDEINNSTNLNIIERTDEVDYVLVTNLGTGCWSYIGKQGAGRDTVNVCGSCNGGGTCGSNGIIIHEFLHAAGFFHEQSRRDRGEHVRINEDNIDPDDLSNFEKYNYGEGVAMGPYDYESVMHYGKNDFAIDETQLTIITRDPSKQDVIGQREGLSRQDIRQINRIYRADGRITDYSNAGRGGGENSWEVENPQSFDIQYEVELVPQSTDISCWAAGAAMLVGWRDQISIDPEEIANGVGYWAYYHDSNTNGLPPDDTNMFQVWDLHHEAPMSYTVQGLMELLAANGPLWVASSEPGPHIRVISGIQGDGSPDGTILTIQDPWQRGMRRFRTPNPGSTYTETYTEFMRKQAELARQEFDISLPIYVAHN